MTEPEPQRPVSRLRLSLAAVAVLVPLIPIAIALSLSGGVGGSATAVTTTSTLRLSVAGASGATSATTATTAASSTPTLPALLLPAGSGALVAQVEHPTGLRSTPGGHVFAKLTTKTPFGSPAVMWVARHSGHWLGVVSPQAGNHRLGWVPASDASLGRVDWELKVSLAARTLTVLKGGRVVQHYTIAIGAPASPTPTGRFAVTDRLLTGDPAGPYGCCILALSAQAPHAIQDWSGGSRIAIHSTPETSSIGQDVSHGCMRLTLAEGRWLIGHIPLGTPTLISS